MDKKYKINLVETRTYTVDVLANNDEEAQTKAKDKFEEIKNLNMEHYYDTGEVEITVGNIYDVTNTDDPFNV